MREDTFTPAMTPAAPASPPVGPFRSLRDQVRRNLELQERIRAFFLEEDEERDEDEGGDGDGTEDGAGGGARDERRGDRDTIDYVIVDEAEQ